MEALAAAIRVRVWRSLEVPARADGRSPGRRARRPTAATAPGPAAAANSVAD